MHLRDLPRHWARRCLALPRFCAHSLGVELRQTSLIVAYSTGLDSTALLHLLHALAPRQGLTLIAAHVHHGLRPESDREEAQARAVCASLGLPLETRRLDVRAEARDQGRGLEETARDLRYAFLETVRREYRADWIVTAHHGDDLAEDIVMRLIRGTGWPGLGGMRGVDPRRCLLRPLLDWEKRELLTLAEDSGLSWSEDASNTSQDLTRNRIRHCVLPLLRAENPALATACGRVWHAARRDEDYWNSLLPAPDTIDTAFLLEAHVLDVSHPALRLLRYKQILERMGPGQVLAEGLQDLERAWADKSFARCFQFPGDKTCTVRRDGILFDWRNRK